MRGCCRVLWGLLTGLFLAVSPSWSTVVTLKDGSSVSGQIVGKDAQGLKVETSEGLRVIEWQCIVSMSEDSTPSVSPAAAAQKEVVIVLKNGREVSGLLVKSDDQRVIVKSGGIEISVARLDIQSMEESTMTSPPSASAPVAGLSMPWEGFSPEVETLMKEMGERLHAGIGKLNAFTGELVLKVDPTGLDLPATSETLDSFQANASLWAQKGGLFRVELSAQDPRTGQSFSLAVASDKDKALARVIANGQEQYFTFGVKDLQSASESRSQEALSAASGQLAQFSQVAKSMTATRGEVERLPLGLADSFTLHIPTDSIPAMATGMPLGPLTFTLWVGVEDDLPYKASVGLGSASDLVTLAFSKIDLDPSVNQAMFTIQVPAGVTPQDLSQFFMPTLTPPPIVP